MKGIKDWAKDMENNEELMKKFEDLKSVEEIIKLAKEEGYEFTEDEFMDLQMEMVSGGGIGGKIGNFMKKTLGYGVKTVGTMHKTIGEIGSKIGDFL